MQITFLASILLLTLAGQQAVVEAGAIKRARKVFEHDRVLAAGNGNKTEGGGFGGGTWNSTQGGAPKPKDPSMPSIVAKNMHSTDSGGGFPIYEKRDRKVSEHDRVLAAGKGNKTEGGGFGGGTWNSIQGGAPKPKDPSMPSIVAKNMHSTDSGGGFLIYEKRDRKVFEHDRVLAAGNGNKTEGGGFGGGTRNSTQGGAPKPNNPSIPDNENFGFL
ncbi:hypothetical protein BY458DRAFT_264934 [Sporodiniella umbellata]|nr:hypothetical protein BY458DRAFT_264934 [Sporodiniella umbellata]